VRGTFHGQDRGFGGSDPRTVFFFLIAWIGRLLQVPQQIGQSDACHQQ
jgi:hypothetical protein